MAAQARAALPPPIAPLLASVVQPLVCGGPLAIGAPIALDRARAWQAALDAGATSASVETQAIDEVRRARAAQLVVAPPPMPLDGDALGLALGLYDALCLAHPEVTGKRVRARVLDTALALVRLPPARDRRALLSRHTLLADVVELSRRDLHVRWWTGKADFRGQAPPARLLRWTGVRRVRTHETHASWHELVAEPVADALFAASPLTDWLTAGRAGPPPDLARAAAVLDDAELVRAVAYHGAVRAHDAWRDAIGAAFVRLVDGTGVAARTIAGTAAVLVYVAQLALGGGLAVAAGGTPGQLAFWALPAIVHERAPVWLAPLLASLPPPARAALLATSARAATELPEPRRARLTERLGGVLAAADPQTPPPADVKG